MLLAQLATLDSYPHIMFPVARSSDLGVHVDLQPCKTMTDTLAPMEHANWVS